MKMNTWPDPTLVQRLLFTETKRKGTHMKTWILCADPLCAKILMKNNDRDEARLCYTIPAQSLALDSGQLDKKFVRYIAEEVDLACGAGTDSQLIICAESSLLAQILTSLNEGTRKCLVGIIGKDLCYAPLGFISRCCRDLQEAGLYGSNRLETLASAVA